ncbi:MAG TPA: WD40 repeat domain-containing protein, partial [Polyangiaceae bacterium LLY-WYZ-15_(1-7)]|nr:WD40 repeat domain-containing protein [Polyangiaceae bacterium LLY-WYZ-15_(1-7)]
MSQAYAPHVERLAAVAATPSGALLVYGGARDLPEGATAKPSLHVLRLPALEPAAAHPLDAAATAITCLDDRRAIVGTADGRLRVVDLESGAAAAVDAHEGAVRAIAFAGDGVYSVGDDGALRIFRRQDGGLEALGERRFGARPLRVAAIGPRGERLALGGDGGTVFVLSLGALDGEPREMAVGEGVRALAFTDDGRVAVGLADGGLRVGYLDGAPDFEDRAGPAAHERAVVGLVFGKALVDEANRPRPRRLYSIGADGAVKAWDLDSRRRPKSEALGGAPRAACWVASREHAAGQLAVVGRGRRVALATLQEDGAVGAIRALGGRLEELAATLRGGSEKARGAALDALSPLPED